MNNNQIKVRDLINNYEQGFISSNELFDQICELRIATEDTIKNGTTCYFFQSNGTWFACQDGDIWKLEFSCKITELK